MSDTKKYLRTEHGERIDQPDFQHAVERSQHNGLTQLGDSVVVGADRARNVGEVDQPRHLVLEGFAVTALGGGLLQVDGGVALVGYRYQHQLQYGALTTGQAAKSVNAGSVDDPTAVHGVWVRFRLREDDHGNRAFWNSTGAPPELVRNIPTRLVEDWDVKVEVGSPGDEWMRIATVQPNLLPGAGLTDRRHFFFEGPADATPAFSIPNTVWGSATDRSVARATSGNFGFARWVAMVNRQLSNIIGATKRHWDSVSSAAGFPHGLEQLSNEKLNRLGHAAVDATGTMLGDLRPDPAFNDGLDVGLSPTQRWKDIFARGIMLGQGWIGSAATALIARIQVDYRDNGGDRTLLFRSGNAVAPGTTIERVYRVKTPATLGEDLIELTRNCFWEAAGNWREDAPAIGPYKITKSANLIVLYTRLGGGPTWTDAIGVGGWTEMFRIDPIIGNIQVTGDIGAVSDVEVGADFKYATSRTFIKSIPAASAHLSGAGIILDTNLGAPAFNLTSMAVSKQSGAAGAAFFPLELPHGATIRNPVRVNMQALAAGTPFEIAVIRIPNGDNVPESLFSSGVQNFGTIAAPGSDFLVTVNMNSTVDNDNFSYGVYVRDPIGGTTTFDIFRVVVRYRLTILELP